MVYTEEEVSSVGGAVVRGGYLVEEASRSVTSTLVYQRSHGRLYSIVVRTMRLCDVHARHPQVVVRTFRPGRRAKINER